MQKKGENMVTEEQEKLAKIVLDCAFTVHTQLGPGLLESTYQACLAYELRNNGLYIEVEKSFPVFYKNFAVDCGYRIDILVEHNKLIVENKAVKQFSDIHLAQILTYMRLSGISLGFILNFNVRHFKDGIKRVVL
jgi:GxxExxY protein